MSKKILALLLVLVMCLTFVACDKSDSDKKKDKYEKETQAVATVDEAEKSDSDEKEGSSSPVLYKATDDDGNVVWLFGSIHVGRDDYYPLPDYVMDAYESSDALAVEFNMLEFEDDMSAQMEALSMLVYTDGTTIKDHIDEDLYDDAVEILDENNMYSSALDYYQPSMWSSFVDNCSYMELELDAETGIDRYFLELADDEDKEILDVESAQFQYSMLAEFSEELQIYMLNSSVESYNTLDESKEELFKLIDAWVSGDEETLVELLSNEENFESEGEMSQEEKELYEEYNNAMRVERNEAMADYAEQALKSDKEVFICVGAAHIVGDGAIADLLKERGYTVERVK